MVTVPHSHLTGQAKSDPVAIPKHGTMWHHLRMAKQRHFIKAWRRHRGLTQQQLGDRVGVDRSYVNKIENGKKRYDQPFLEAAAEALRCEPADLIMRDPSQPGSIWSIWEAIPASERPQAQRVLEAFAKKAS